MGLQCGGFAAWDASAASASASAEAVGSCRSHSSSERPVCWVCWRSSLLSRVVSTQVFSSATRGRSFCRQAAMACATTARSDRAWLKRSWSVSHWLACASLVTRPLSTAASSTSEYENPPTGSAGEASHISCSRLTAGRADGGSGGMAGRVEVSAVAVVMLGGRGRVRAGGGGHGRQKDAQLLSGGRARSRGRERGAQVPP
ncbi:MAG: hypothetical protein K2W33_05935 [Burkholderiales bacterium]|nr:hypothetical protein [Burkholderiales bacterium]